MKDVVRRLGQIDGVTDIESPLHAGQRANTVSKDGRSVLVTFSMPGKTETKEDLKQLETLADAPLAAVAAVQRAHRELRVEEQGEASQQKALAPQEAKDETKSTMKSHLQIVFLLVLSLAFILLLVTFRSIVVPIKAIILNLLSVGSAYGLLTWLFQDGHGEKALGFTSVGGITPWLPLFLFVVLFGLSMDYHVFVISRIRELVDRGMSTDNAVAHGIKSTAGVITSAAAVMVVTFGASPPAPART